jgi:D-alanine--poly(phosphoribitol) ligase subunit 1
MLSPNDPVRRFLDQVAKRPDSEAVIADGVTTTYGGMGRMVRRMAAAMARRGDHPRVLVLLEPGMAAYAAMFAALHAGGYYAPVNTGAPLVKQQALFRDFAPDLVVGTAAAYEALTQGEASRPPLLEPDALPDEELEASRPPHELAYVIFTSGSTGNPKGVMLSRAGLGNYIDWMHEAMAVTAADRWSQHPNIGFDLSVMDIYGALCAGAVLVRLGLNEARLMPALAIRKHGLTIWNSVPSVVDIMRQGRQLTTANLASLRLMTFCGEPLLREHLDGIFAARPDLLVHNTYGPTEATVSCTLIRLRAEDYASACSTSVAIGEAITNMEVHLVGGDSPDEGEIVIVGPQVAVGYWNNPAASEAAFRWLEISGRRVRAYCTGDWAQRVEGQTYFRSRVDFQVKVNGFRLELDEINSALRKLGYVAAASALVGGELHAFIETSAQLDEEGLRRQLVQQLEPHAVPRHFHALDHLPRNANDKIDVKALAAMIEGRAAVSPAL